MPDDSSLKSAARGAAWPVRRVLDPRFADITRRIASVLDTLNAQSAETWARLGGLESAVARQASETASHSASALELAAHVGERLDATEAELERLGSRLEAIASEMAGRPDPAAPPAAQVSRAALQEAFALRALGACPPSARVLLRLTGDGALPGLLAAMGLLVDTAGFDDAAPGGDGAYRGVALLGTLEAPPAGRPGDGARRELVAGARAALGGDGVLVIGARLGGEQGALDPAALDDLLDGWEIVERAQLVRTGPAGWEAATAPAGEAVALVSARPRAA